MLLNIIEGMTLSDAVVESERVLNTPRLTLIMSPDGSICEGAKIGGVKIWFPRNLRTTRDELERQILAGMKLKEMTMYNGEKAFFLIPDLTFIKDGIHFQEIFERPEIEMKWIKDKGASIIKGVKISTIKIWFPINYRRIEDELDLAALKEMPLKKDLEMENKYFLKPPLPELIPDKIITEGQTLKDFLEEKDFSYIFNQYHGTISGVKFKSIPIFFPTAYQVSETELDRDALGAMRIKRSTIMELAYFLEP